MWMSNLEVKFFEKHLESNQRVLEWGCGSSTISISKLVKEICRLEGDISKFVPAEVATALIAKYNG